MYFLCPACEKKLHIRNAGNLFPINFKLKCKYCDTIFGFVPKVFSVGKISEDDALKMIEDESSLKSLANAIKKHDKNVKKEKRNQT